MRARFGLGEALTFIGAAVMIVSVFLFWTEGVGGGSPFQAIDSEGLAIPFFIVAALCFGAFAARARGVLPALAFVGLGFAGLALVGNFAYEFFAEFHYALGDLREGFYVAGAGGLLVFIGGFLKIR